MPLKKRFNDRSFLNSISGMVLSEFFRGERNTLGASEAKFTSPEALMFPPEAMDTIYLRLLFALKERNVEQIFSPFTWGIAEAFAFMENHWAELCNDIELGEITFALDVPEDFFRKMNGMLLPDPKRAAELREIFCAGFERPIAKLIWPKLQRVIAAGTGSFKIYTARIKRYLGDVDFSNGFFASSEMFLGKAIGGDDYELVSDTNFYEFLPVGAAENSRPLFLSEVEVGAAYEVIVTNHAGLYRYRTGDIIRVKACDFGRLIFNYVGRKGQTLTIDSATLTEDEIYSALVKVDGIELADFAFFADETNRLTILLRGKNFSDAKIFSAVDSELCAVNESYAAARRNGLPACRVEWTQPQTHLLYRDMERFRKKTAPDQIKPTHFLNTADKIKFFMSNLQLG